MCIAVSTVVAHNTAQNRPDNFPSYPPDNNHCYDDVYLREGGEEAAQDFYRPGALLLPNQQCQSAEEKSKH